MEEALSVKAVAEKLSISKMTVYRLVANGQLKAFRTGVQNHGGGIRIWPSDLKAFTERADQPTPQPTAELEEPTPA